MRGHAGRHSTRTTRLDVGAEGAPRRLAHAVTLHQRPSTPGLAADRNGWPGQRGVECEQFARKLNCGQRALLGSARLHHGWQAQSRLEPRPRHRASTRGSAGGRSSSGHGLDGSAQEQHEACQVRSTCPLSCVPYPRPATSPPSLLPPLPGHSTDVNAAPGLRAPLRPHHHACDCLSVGRYDDDFKELVVREAMRCPEGARIKPTCSRYPGVEPCQVRGQDIAIALALPPLTCSDPVASGALRSCASGSKSSRPCSPSAEPSSHPACRARGRAAQPRHTHPGH